MKFSLRFSVALALAVSSLAWLCPQGTAADNAQKKIEHVVLIGVDGGGAFFREADTPNLDNIFKNGAVSYNVLTSKPSISAQCWGSMLHGAVGLSCYPRKHARCESRIVLQLEPDQYRHY